MMQAFLGPKSKAEALAQVEAELNALDDAYPEVEEDAAAQARLVTKAAAVNQRAPGEYNVAARLADLMAGP